jgi:hypothetical protein
MSEQGETETCYFGKNGKWYRYKQSDCSIWIINPDTGHFVYADYWYGSNVKAVFHHKKYISELLINLSEVVVEMGCCKLLASTYITIYGYKHYLYFDTYLDNMCEARRTILDSKYLVVDPGKAMCLTDSRSKIEGEKTISYDNIIADHLRTVFIDCHASRTAGDN